MLNQVWKPIGGPTAVVLKGMGPRPAAPEPASPGNLFDMQMLGPLGRAPEAEACVLTSGQVGGIQLRFSTNGLQRCQGFPAASSDDS